MRRCSGGIAVAKSEAEQRKQDVELAEVWSDPHVEEIGSSVGTLSNRAYLRELATLQIELVKQLEWDVIKHQLSLIPDDDLTPEPIVLRARQGNSGSVRPAMADQTFVPEVY